MMTILEFKGGFKDIVDLISDGNKEIVFSNI